MNEDPRILVALGQGLSGHPNTVILGMTDHTWADLEGGKAQDVDLRPLGMPVTLLIMRGTDHDDVVKQLQEAAGQVSLPVSGLADLSVPKPPMN